MTSQGIANKWARRSGGATAEMRRAVQQLGRRALAISLKHMNADIYAKPVDATASGKPKWRRTGQLKGHERVVPSVDGLGFALVNDMEYAEARHEMGKAGSKRKTTRPAHWRDEMREELRQEIPAVFHAMNQRILRGGG